jgi:hypothetical protein
MGFDFQEINIIRGLLDAPCSLAHPASIGKLFLTKSLKPTKANKFAPTND